MHGLFHKFSSWSAVMREPGSMITGVQYQTRECKKCGYVQKRWL